MGLDVLLITPRSTYVNEFAQKVYPPLNLLYLAASLREHGYTVDVLDANAWRLSDQQIEAAVRAASPRLVGIAVYSEILAQVRRLTCLAKSAGAGRVVLGGPHAAAVPEQTLGCFPEADFILCGEAENTLPMFVRDLDRAQEYPHIPGLWWRENGALRMSPYGDRPDIRRVPLPARDLVEPAYRAGRYYTILVRDRPVDTIMTSRGCPFHCGFCYNTNHKYRGRDPEDVVSELVSIRQRGIRNVEIVDDHFTVDRARAIRIFDLIIREKLGISFRIKSRVNVVDEEFLARARQAGAYQISYGAESGIQSILDAMDKRIKVADIARAVDLTRRAGMAAHTSWVLGYPGETPETIARTVDFIVKVKPTTANVAILRPYPGTTAYVEARQAGMLAGEWHPDADSIPWVRLPWVQCRADLDRVVKKALRRVYCRPHYLIAFGSEIVRNTNWMLARYALQELRRTFSLHPARTNAR
ncbi:MAG TPA: radical SAM protein [Phycisphaerae bacterium]|nr:radical SAM protein [Phycisphaerae bacterium]